MPPQVRAELINAMFMNDNVMTSGEYSKERRRAFFRSSVALLLLLALYPFTGMFLMALFAPESVGMGREEFLGPEMAGKIRLVQIVGQLLVLAAPAWFLARYQPALGGLGLGGAVPWRDVGLAVLAVTLLQPFLFTFMELIAMALERMGPFGRGLLDGQEALEEFLLFLTRWNGPFEFLFVVVMIAVVPALTEELFFRGYVQRSYAMAIGPLPALLVTGVVFAMFHMSPVNFLPLMLMGWFLGWVLWKSGHLLVAIAVHFSNNFMSLLWIEYERSHSGLGEFDGADVLATFWWWPLLLGTLLGFVVVMRAFGNRGKVG